MVLAWMWMDRRRMRAGGWLVDVGGLMGESITKVLPLFGWYYHFSGGITGGGIT